MNNKIKNFVILGLFIVCYLLNACTPHLMESYRHLNQGIFIISGIFRLFSLSSILLIPLILLYDDKRAVRLNTYFVLPSAIIEMCFLKSYFSVATVTPYDITAYILYNLSLIAISIWLIIKNQQYLKPNPKDLFSYLVMLILLMPLNIFMNSENLMQNEKIIYKNFGLFYFLFMIIFVLVTILLTRFLKHRQDREEILFMLSLVLVYHIFTRFSYVRLQDYQTAKGIVGALPFYICSFGIMLLPIAIYSKKHILQSIAFLINTPGAIIVLVRPTVGIVGIFHYDVTYFFFSHILLFAVTIQLAIYLYGKPTLKDVKNASIFLFGYFVVMTIFNIFAESLSNNYNPNFSFVAVAPLPVDVKIFGQFKIWKSTFTPVYIIILWIIHCALAAVAYGGFKLIDHLHKNRLERKLISA